MGTYNANTWEVGWRAYAIPCSIFTTFLMSMRLFQIEKLEDTKKKKNWKIQKLIKQKFKCIYDRKKSP